MSPLPQPLAALLVLFASLVQRRQDHLVEYLMEENRILREQLGGRRLRLTDDQRRRLAVRGKPVGRKALARIAVIAAADTILRWHRQLVGRKYDASRRRGVGRPPTPKPIADLAVRMARENPWGYTRIRDALGGVGHKIGRSTVRRILENHGVAPAPERHRRTPWKVFLAAHWEAVEGAVSFDALGTGAGRLVRDAGLAVVRLTARWIDIASTVSGTARGVLERTAALVFDALSRFAMRGNDAVHGRRPLCPGAPRHVTTAHGMGPEGCPTRLHGQQRDPRGRAQPALPRTRASPRRRSHSRARVPPHDRDRKAA